MMIIIILKIIYIYYNINSNHSMFYILVIKNEEVNFREYCKK